MTLPMLGSASIHWLPPRKAKMWMPLPVTARSPGRSLVWSSALRLGVEKRRVVSPCPSPRSRAVESCHQSKMANCTRPASNVRMPRRKDRAITPKRVRLVLTGKNQMATQSDTAASHSSHSNLVVKIDFKESRNERPPQQNTQTARLVQWLFTEFQRPRAGWLRVL
jgi:hypothetical protein